MSGGGGGGDKEFQCLTDLDRQLINVGWVLCH